MDEWATFLAHALERRLPSDKFEQFATALSIKAPLSPLLIADLLLRPTKSQNYDLDPQVSLYVQSLLKADVLDLPVTLRSLLKYSTFRSVETTTQEQEDAKNSAQLRWTKSYFHEESLMYGLSKIVAAGARPKSSQEAVTTVQALTEWLRLLVMAGAADDMMQEMGAGNEVHNQETMAVRVAVGALLVAVTENGKVNEGLTKGCPKGRYSNSSPYNLPGCAGACWPRILTLVEGSTTQGSMAGGF